MNIFIYLFKAGCTETLKRMNRKYNAEDIEKVCKNLRENFKDTMLTADIIVRFSTEKLRKSLIKLIDF